MCIQHASVILDLKSELDRQKRSSKDQSDQLSRLKKQLDTSEHRLSELKKSSSSDSSELKELRHKLRVAEQNVAKVDAKQSEMAELRKAANAERTRAEKAERDAKEMKDRLEREQAARRDVEKKAEEKEREARKAKDAKDALQDGTHELKEEVAQLRSLLSMAIERHSRVWSQSVPRSDLDKERLESASLKFCIARLQRKLGNAEEQVVELASLVRQGRAEKEFLQEELAETHERLGKISAFSEELLCNDSAPQEAELPLVDLLISERRGSEHLSKVQSILTTIATSLLAWYRHSLSDMLLHHTITSHLLDIESNEHNCAISQLSAAQKAVSELQMEHDNLTVKSLAQDDALSKMNARMGEVSAAHVETEKNSKTTVARLEGQMQREREIAQRMQSGMQQAKMAEEALKDEINK